MATILIPSPIASRLRGRKDSSILRGVLLLGGVGGDGGASGCGI